MALLSPRFHRLYGFAWLEIGLAAEWGSQVVVLKLACNPNLVMIDWNLLISWIIRCSILVSFGIAWVLKFEENITFRFRWELSLRTVDKLWCDSTFWELLKGFKLDNSFSTILWNQVFSQMFQKVRNLLLQFYLKLSRVILCPRLTKKQKNSKRTYSLGKQFNMFNKFSTFIISWMIAGMYAEEICIWYPCAHSIYDKTVSSERLLSALLVYEAVWAEQDVLYT